MQIPYQVFKDNTKEGSFHIYRISFEDFFSLIKEKIEDNDGEGTHKLNHDYKNIVENLGTINLFEVSGKLDGALNNNDLDNIKRHLIEFENEHKKVIDSLTVQLSSEAA